MCLCGHKSMFLWGEKKGKATELPGAIPEIGQRVGVIPQCYTSTLFSDHLSQFILKKRPEASSKDFICCILYQTSLKSLR